MPEIRLPNRAAINESQCWEHWIDGVPFVTKDLYEAMIADLRLLHEHDMDWARRVCAARGIDLDDLADRDPTYRAEFRV